MTTVHDVPDSILIRVCELFLRSKKMTTQQMADAANAEIAKLGIDLEITREQIYPLIREAVRRGYLELLPPQDLVLQDRLVHAFGSGIHVVNVSELDQLAATAAKIAADLIEELRQQRDLVHVGLGAGMTSQRVARHLAARLRAAERLPKLRFHALTSGFRADRIHTAPVSFFGFFQDVPTEVSYVGLFAPASTGARRQERGAELLGMDKSFAERDEIDIVVTALGSPSHGHGDFYDFVNSTMKEKGGAPALRRRGWVGDVQYRPYTARGPLKLDERSRALALFELEDLVELAQKKDKHVVLVAGPCGDCLKPRPDAIHPLLVEPKLKVWTRLVTDVVTAHELLGPDASGRAG